MNEPVEEGMSAPAEAVACDPVEDHAMEYVRERLVVRFATLDREHVEQVVAEEHAKFDDAHVRVYVPALVEHAADRRLRQEGDPDHSLDGGPGGPVIVSNEPSDLDPIQIEHRKREQRPGFLLGDLGGGPV